MNSTSLIVIYLLHSLLALIVGSFLSMLSYRLVQHLDSDTPTLLRALIGDRSRCPHCQRTLSITQLIPLIGWWRQRHASSCCAQPISWRYPLIELATLIVSLITLTCFIQRTDNSWYGLDTQGWAVLTLSWWLIAITITDIEHQLIPDRLSLPLLWAGLLVNSSPWAIVDLSQAVWGSAIGYSSLWLLFQVHRALTGKEGMGYGDFKLSAALGAWLGMYALIPIFILAGSLAVLVMGAVQLWKKQGHAAFAFGPWLAIAAWLVLLNTLQPQG